MGRPTGCQKHGFHEYEKYRKPCDHSTCGWKPREEEPEPCVCAPDEACDTCDPEEPPLTPEEEEEAPCPHAAWDEHRFRLTDGTLAASRKCTDCGESLPTIPVDEAPEDRPFVQTCVRPGCIYDVRKDCRYGCKAAADELTQLDQEEMDQRWAKAMGDDEPQPLQPAGRPPFAVNYSVQGHLYQVAVPGDATVKAVDGALVIQHYLGPVAGIVQVLPIISEESHAAEADQ